MTAQSLNASQILQIKEQPAASQSQKPTESDLRLYWQTKFIERIDSQIFFDLIKKYGEHIINEKDPEMHWPMVIWATNNARDGGWSISNFERLLQTPGINLNIECSPYTPLTKAIASLDDGYEQDEIQLQKLKLLIKYGADINQKKIACLTPLMYAACSNKPKAVAILLAAGASTEGKVSVLGKVRKTFFYFAQQHPAVKQVYDEHQAKLASHQSSGSTQNSNSIDRTSIDKTICEYQKQNEKRFGTLSWDTYYMKVHSLVSPYFVQKSQLIPILQKMDAIKELIEIFKQKEESAMVVALEEELTVQQASYDTVVKQGTYEGPDF